MSIRRTRQQKISAGMRREEVSYSFSAHTEAKVAAEKLPRSTSAADIFGYPVRLIYQDLFKSVVIMLLVMAALVSTYFTLR